MRSDYGLYGVAIICFIIAGAFMANMVPGYSLTEALGITVIMIFLLIGIISAAVGYSARPKAIMPVTQPTPAPAAPPQETPTAATLPHEEMPPSPPPTPPPVEEVTAEAPPPQEAQPSPTQPIVTPTEPEQPAKIAEEEKPKAKPVRRRRKKAQS